MNIVKKFLKIVNIFIIFSCFCVILLRFLPINETDIMYQAPGSTYQYWNVSLETYNSSEPPWKECMYDKIPPVCYWHNVPPTRDQTYMHVTNPRLAWVYDHDGVITICLLIIGVIVNGGLLWLKRKHTD